MKVLDGQRAKTARGADMFVRNIFGLLIDVHVGQRAGFARQGFSKQGFSKQPRG
ncbi:hypothetical protein [Saccharopolyspora spinosa]|uniref:hypothetical protein n=1 Tax=Saccharopolyspora spinosa TaxID=60894 RepID=UPI00023797CF|nr:hypothetical protein [Saccharopolyspora spinosa]